MSWAASSVVEKKFHFAIPLAAADIYNDACFHKFIYVVNGGLRMKTRVLSITTAFLTLTLLSGAASAKTTSIKHTSSRHPSTSTHKTVATSGKHSSRKSTSAHSHGQRNIGEDRTRQIQSALIREHYLTGEPTGVWDAQSKDAMMRFQSANGWQSKVVPDSRALIKLGLGPDHKGLLNPDTAVVASPHELGTQHEALPGGSSQP